MRIEKLNISNLRNHTYNEIEFSEGLNIFYGLNGTGKTTILEAIAIAAFSKSFLPVQDNSLLKAGKDKYAISLKAINDYGIPYNITITFDKKNKKEINSNIGDRLSPKEIIGEIPCIILSPDFKSITFGAPGDRRDFIDKLLSQSSRKYLEELIKYRKTLRQRNYLLQQAKISNSFDADLFATLTDLLIKSGAEIVNKRIGFIKRFKPIFNEIYKYVSESKEMVTLDYRPNELLDLKDNEQINIEDIIQSYTQVSEKIVNEELRRGLTLFGPQRDDLKIIINGGPAKERASQGQHKSILISLKFAEFNYLKEIKNETPIALFDDIFSELDAERTLKVLSLLELNHAQTMITITDMTYLQKQIPPSIKFKTFELNAGKIVKTK